MRAEARAALTRNSVRPLCGQVGNCKGLPVKGQGEAKTHHTIHPALGSLRNSSWQLQPPEGRDTLSSTQRCHQLCVLSWLCLPRGPTRLTHTKVTCGQAAPGGLFRTQVSKKPHREPGAQGQDVAGSEGEDHAPRLFTVEAPACRADCPGHTLG